MRIMNNKEWDIGLNWGSIVYEIKAGKCIDVGSTIAEAFVRRFPNDVSVVEEIPVSIEMQTESIPTSENDEKPIKKKRRKNKEKS